MQKKCCTKSFTFPEWVFVKKGDTALFQVIPFIVVTSPTISLFGLHFLLVLKCHVN